MVITTISHYSSGSAISDESDIKEVNGSDDMQSSHCTKQVVEHLQAGFKKDNILKVKKTSGGEIFDAV
jgi:hypothetical protein